MLKIVKNWGVRRNANVAFASHLCPRFPPHFFWKQQIYANPFFWFFTFSVILADLHSDTEKKLLHPVVSRMSGVYREFWAKIMEITIRKLTVHLTLGRTRKVVPPPWYKGGGLMEPLPRVFDMLQYFETILPSLESLWYSLQDEVYFMGGGAAWGLWRHQTWSSSWSPSWILSRVRNEVKTVRINNFLCLTR